MCYVLNIFGVNVKSYFLPVCYKLDRFCNPQKNQLEIREILVFLICQNFNMGLKFSIKYQWKLTSWKLNLCHLLLKPLPLCNWNCVQNFKLSAQNNFNTASAIIYVFLILTYWLKHQFQNLNLALWFTLGQLEILYILGFFSWYILIPLQQNMCR